MCCVVSEVLFFYKQKIIIISYDNKQKHMTLKAPSECRDFRPFFLDTKAAEKCTAKKKDLYKN